MSKSKQDQLDEFLYKPIVLHDPEQGERLILIFSCEQRSSQNINSLGKISKSNETIVHILEISKSLDLGRSIIETYTVNNISKFKNNITHIPIEECVNILNACNTLLITEMTVLSGQLSQMSKALTALKRLEFPIFSDNNNENPVAEGNLIISNESTGLANIVFKAITGDIAKLTKEDLQKIGGVIMDCISSHSADDIDDADQIRKIKAELDYKIVEAMPDTMKTGKIQLNMDAIIEEIKKYRKSSNENEDEEDNNENGSINE